MKRLFFLSLIMLPLAAWSAEFNDSSVVENSASSGLLVEKPSVIQLFKSMPDSIMPYLTENNRLDMIDFMEAGMKAEVTNRMDNKSEMLYISDDSLSIRMSESMKIDLFVMPTEEVYDSCQNMLCMRRTFYVNGREAQTVDTFYSVSWRSLPLSPATHHTPIETIFSLDKVVNLRGRKNF